MRNTFKTVVRTNVVVRVYDPVKKAEEDIALVVIEGVNELKVPDGLVEISRKETSRQEIRMKLSPENFIKYAVVVDDEE